MSRKLHHFWSGGARGAPLHRAQQERRRLCRWQGRQPRRADARRLAGPARFRDRGAGVRGVLRGSRLSASGSRARCRNCEVDDTAALAEVSARVREMVLAEPLPRWLEDAIRAAYDELTGGELERRRCGSLLGDGGGHRVRVVRRNERDVPQRARQRRRSSMPCVAAGHRCSVGAPCSTAPSAASPRRRWTSRSWSSVRWRPRAPA